MCGIGYTSSCTQDSECGSGLCVMSPGGYICTMGQASDPCESESDCADPGASCIFHPNGG